MALTSSGTSLTSSYYLRNFYAFNRNAIKSSGRNDYTATELSYEDTRALRRAVKALDKYKYDENDNSGNVYGSIAAFIDIYNNTLDSAQKGDSHDMERYSRKLKNLTKKYSEQLNEIGITIKGNGRLSYNENLLKGAKIDKVKEVFGSETGFTRQLKQISKSMNEASLNDVYTALTGKGQQINITL